MGTFQSLSLPHPTLWHPWAFLLWNYSMIGFMTTFSSYFPSTSFFPFIFISWRLITLQYCSGFCHTLTWITITFQSPLLNVILLVTTSLTTTSFWWLSTLFWAKIYIYPNHLLNVSSWMSQWNLKHASNWTLLSFSIRTFSLCPLLDSLLYCFQSGFNGLLASLNSSWKPHRYFWFFLLNRSLTSSISLKPSLYFA